MNKVIQLEEFKNNFFKLMEQPLSYGEFLGELKEKYWLPGKEWLADALPLKEVKRLS